MSTIRVYPNPDALVEGVPVKVRDPARGDYLPAEGREVPRDQYWLRRLRDGDVREGEPESAARSNSHGDKAEKYPHNAAKALRSAANPNSEV